MRLASQGSWELGSQADHASDGSICVRGWSGWMMSLFGMTLFYPKSARSAKTIGSSTLLGESVMPIGMLEDQTFFCEFILVDGC